MKSVGFVDLKVLKPITSFMWLFILYSSSTYESPVIFASGLFRATIRSTPLESCSVSITELKFVGTSVATVTFKVNITAKMAKVSVERVLWDEISAGAICPTPFTPLILTRNVRNAFMSGGRFTDTNRTEPTTISMTPIIKMSGAKPEMSGIHSPIATTNRKTGAAHMAIAVKFIALTRLMKRESTKPMPENSKPEPIRIFLHSSSVSHP